MTEELGAFFASFAARFSFKDSNGCFFDSFELFRSLLMLFTPCMAQGFDHSVKVLNNI